MPCLAAPKLPYPPGLSLLLPTLTLSPPAFGVTFCCTLEEPPIPGFPLIVNLTSLIPAGLALLFQAALPLIMSAIDQLNVLLDQIQFSCPLE